MSVQAMAWALTQQEVTDPPARHVLLCLANYASVEGRNAFPSAATLAKDSGLSERTVRAKLEALAAAGLIRRGRQAIAAAEIDRADRRPVVFDLAIERGAPDAPRKAVDKKRAQAVDNSANGVQLTHERGAALAPNPRALTVKLSKPIDRSPEAKAKTRRSEGNHLASIKQLLEGAIG